MNPPTAFLFTSPNIIIIETDNTPALLPDLISPFLETLSTSLCSLRHCRLRSTVKNDLETTSSIQSQSLPWIKCSSPEFQPKLLSSHRGSFTKDTTAQNLAFPSLRNPRNQLEVHPPFQSIQNAQSKAVQIRDEHKTLGKARDCR